MSSPDTAIGGYFELALPEYENRSDSLGLKSHIALNSARNCLEYLLQARSPKRVYLPRFTCDVMLEPLQKTNTECVFYSINHSFEIVDDLEVSGDEILVYTNYFGIKDEYSFQLAEKYGERLVVDASQALFYKQHGNEHVIYSPRKFVGVADGGYLVTDCRMDTELEQDVSYGRMSHLLKRAELGAEAGYEDFRKNDHDLVGQPIKTMSRLTQMVLNSVDYASMRESRSRNFSLLHHHLASRNELTISLGSFEAPLVYPFMVREAGRLRRELIDHKVFVATYWPNVFEWCNESEIEYALARDIIPLPIDQRYDEHDMKKMMEVINGN